MRPDIVRLHLRDYFDLENIYTVKVKTNVLQGSVNVNSLKIVEKIPGAWLVQIKDAGHAVMDQYPEEIGKILNTFLSTTGQSN